MTSSFNKQELVRTKIAKFELKVFHISLHGHIVRALIPCSVKWMAHSFAYGFGKSPFKWIWIGYWPNRNNGTIIQFVRVFRIKKGQSSIDFAFEWLDWDLFSTIKAIQWWKYFCIKWNNQMCSWVLNLYYINSEIRKKLKLIFYAI